MGDVAKETKALFCTEQIAVDEEATFIESEWAYPERTFNKLAEILASVEAVTSAAMLSNINNCQPRS